MIRFQAPPSMTYWQMLEWSGIYAYLSKVNADRKRREDLNGSE